MTNAELLALLREAQPWIQRDSPVEATDLLMRIDAALAEHDAEPVVESEVKWHSINSPQWFEAKENGALLTVKYVAKAEWHWTVEQRTGGHKRSVEEAKSAALAAARGMK